VIENARIYKKYIMHLLAFLMTEKCQTASRDTVYKYFSMGWTTPKLGSWVLGI